MSNVYFISRYFICSFKNNLLFLFIKFIFSFKLLGVFLKAALKFCFLIPSSLLFLALFLLIAFSFGFISDFATSLPSDICNAVIFDWMSDTVNDALLIILDFYFSLKGVKNFVMELNYLLSSSILSRFFFFFQALSEQVQNSL